MKPSLIPSTFAEPSGATRFYRAINSDLAFGTHRRAEMRLAIKRKTSGGASPEVPGGQQVETAVTGPVDGLKNRQV